MGVRRILHGGSSETERLFTMKIDSAQDAILAKTKLVGLSRGACPTSFLVP